MRNCKRCKKPFEAKPAPNGIRPNKCNSCLYAIQREKQILYRQRAEKKEPKQPKEKGSPRVLELTYKIRVNLADLAFSRYIRLRDRGRCITCGDIRPWQQQENGHFIPRASMATRYDERNNNCQCKDCNEFKQGSIPLYRQALIEKYGEQTVLELMALKRQIRLYTAEELNEIITTYTKQANELIKLYEPART